MRKFALALSVLGLVMPGTATAHTRSVKQKYTDLYYAVKKKHGKRAPGRNIRLHGVHTKDGARPATRAELLSSIGTLSALLHPYLVPGAPAVPPSGAATARAGYPLTAIAACESGGDPTAVDPTGQYRGRYQFTRSTWASVGGSGDPAAAPAAEQDQRAAALYAREGRAPWPVCGR